MNTDAGGNKGREGRAKRVGMRSFKREKENEVKGRA